jgi:MoxR-vWA-beta-propeller ternary system domain bpX2
LNDLFEPTVVKGWCAKMARAEAISLGPLRLIPGIFVFVDGESIWIRGDGSDEAIDLLLRKLPATRFNVVEENRLLEPGKRIPRGVLPGGQWVAIADWLRPLAPTAALPGAAPVKTALTWGSSDRVEEARILRTDPETFRAWALRVAMVRLEGLRFAVSEAGSVLVWGEPVPPIPGRRFLEREAVAWPCGMACEPAVDAKILRRITCAAGGDHAEDLILFNDDGSFTAIAASAFVAVTRAAVRLSLPENILPEKAL